MTGLRKRVLLTGATGLIGGYAVRALLARGLDVFAVGRRPCQNDSVSWVRADLLGHKDMDVVFNAVHPDYLLHLAWDTRPGYYLEANSNFAWLGASLRILDSFLRHGGKRVVMAGTCFEYDLSAEFISETSALRPSTVYAQCKNHLNELATLFCERNGLSYGWGRIFYVYGAHEMSGRLTPSVIEAACKNEPFLLKNPDAVRDYAFAGDIAGAFAAFLMSEVDGPVNIASGKGVSIKDYCRSLVGKITEKDVLIFSEGANEQQAGHCVVGDITRLKNEVGFVPAYDLDRGFDAMLREMQLS